MNSSAVQRPSPVSASGVRLAVKLVPHGPDQAVIVAETAVGQSGVAFGASPGANAAGCPDSMRDMSGSGPSGVICHGVWQSLQPIAVTRYLPRSTGVRSGSLPTEKPATAAIRAATEKVTILVSGFTVIPLQWVGRLRDQRSSRGPGRSSR